MKLCPACSLEYPDDRTHCERDGVVLVALTTSGGGRAEDLVGMTVDGRYLIEQIIGRGGMGTVYACRHVVVQKPFAMKVLKQGVEQTGDTLQRFIREAQTANSVRSRHIAEMNDFGQLSTGQFYITMELLEGMDLGKALKRGLTAAQMLHIFIQCCDVLELTHQRGIIHRDLKPDNIFLVREDEDPLFVKLLDFGIAKALHAGPSGLTETGVVLGTPYYMSPEQARGAEVDHRTDIYSLGVIMYRAFTGKLPFVADSAVGVLTRHLTEMPELPSRVGGVEPHTERVILTCLEKRPADRFPNMASLAAALRAIATGQLPHTAIRDEQTTHDRPGFPVDPSRSGGAPAYGTGQQRPMSFTGSEAQQRPMSFTGSEAQQRPMSYQGSEAQQRPVSYQGSEAQQRPMSYQGSEAQQRPVSYQGSEAQQRPMSYQGSEAQQRPMSYQGSEAQQRPMSYQGSEAQQRPVSYQGSEAQQRPVSFTGSQQAQQRPMSYSGAQAQAPNPYAPPPALSASQGGPAVSNPYAPPPALSASQQGPSASGPYPQANLSASQQGPSASGPYPQANLSASQQGPSASGPYPQANLSASGGGPPVSSGAYPSQAAPVSSGAYPSQGLAASQQGPAAYSSGPPSIGSDVTAHGLAASQALRVQQPPSKKWPLAVGAAAMLAIGAVLAVSFGGRGSSSGSGDATLGAPPPPVSATATSTAAATPSGAATDAPAGTSATTTSATTTPSGAPVAKPNTVVPKGTATPKPTASATTTSTATKRPEIRSPFD